MNVLLVGAGQMATAYGHVLNALGVSWRSVGRGAASAASFEATCGVRPFIGGLATYLEQNQLAPDTFVILALPMTQLARAARGTAAAGAARILLEKPGGITIAETGQTAEAMARTGVKAFVAYNRRFYASVTAAREIISKDGGVTSFHFEFTELESAKRLETLETAVLRNWFFANSSHVVDLAFYLGGEPAVAEGLTQGMLAWHPAAATFVGHGRTETGALFTWHADWLSAGRWGLDLRTAQRRIILQPLEELRVQAKGTFDVERVGLGDALDRDFKPGLYRQVQAFLSEDPAAHGLLTLDDQVAQAKRWFLAICPERQNAGLKPMLAGTS